MSTRFCLTPFLVQDLLWPPFSFIARKISCPVLKAEILSLFAPLTLLVLLVCWILLVVFGFGLITLGLGGDYLPHVKSAHDACYISANAVLTIGPVSEFIPNTGLVKVLMLFGALVGMILIGSILSLIFGLAAALQPRETMVSVISNLGGTPPSGIAILEQYCGNDGQYLHSFFDECHRWCADVLGTHRAFPILPFFRSNDPHTSWLTALGAVLDAIALLISVAPDKTSVSARMTYKLGSKLLREFVAIFKLTPGAADPIGDNEFQRLYRQLESAGYCSSDEEEAKEKFRLLRLEYAGPYKALCEYLVVPTTCNSEFLRDHGGYQLNADIPFALEPQ